MTYREIRFKNYKSKSKYRNKLTDYKGNKYHSKFESKVAQELDLRIKSGELVSVDRQVKISLDVNGEHITNWYIDFVATRNDGVLEYIEAKGFETPEYRFKIKLFQAIYKDMLDKGVMELKVIRYDKYWKNR